MYGDLIKPLFGDAKTFILDTLFPIHCLACGKEGKFVCDGCQPLLKTLQQQHCIICGQPSPFGLTHPRCQSPWAADQLISFFDYHDSRVADSIIKGKYYFLPEVYRIFGRIMADRLQSDYPLLLNLSPLILCPVPLHSWRQRWRGFNQSEVACRIMGQELSLPVQELLTRARHTQTQKDLNKTRRRDNVAGAFKPADITAIRGCNTILVDDVTTTGATLLSAAQILKRHGAAKVVCLTIARD